MADVSQQDASKTRTYVWVSLAFTAMGGAIGFLAGEYHKSVDREDRLYAAKIEIVKQIQGTNVGLIDALMSYLLAPIETDTDRFKKFREDVLNSMTAKAERLPAASSLEQQALTVPPSTKFPYTTKEIQSKFSGVERLKFSNELVSLYPTFKSEVVDTLMNSLIKEKLEWSGDPYRNNLYVLFTLARIPGGWAGTPAQLAIINRLKGSANNDETFARRLEEAAKNHVLR